jgi:ribosome-associated protein
LNLHSRLVITYYNRLFTADKIYRFLPGVWYNLRNKAEEILILEGLELARKAVDAASDKQANNIVLLDLRELCSFTDYFVICAGENARQIRTISDEIEKTLKKEGVLPHHHEGSLDSGWLLLDYSDVIVHIFGAAERDYYSLDELWREAKAVLRIQ